MLNKIVTLPRLIFVLIFGYVGANISAFFAYNQGKADSIDYLAGGAIAVFTLAVGIGFGYSYLKKQESNKEINAEIMGFILATIIEIGINTYLIFSNL
ncbi:MAG: hypothetical protein WCT08_00150 [Patescibacteria group bacterium]|jgi:uncharacterized membrane protein AbrB (regulator of aidB expression)